MQELKTKFFEVLGSSIPIKEFEHWLYSSPEIINSMQTDDFIFRVVSLNYRDDHIFHELNKLCFSVYSYQEFLIEMIERICLAFDERLSDQAVNELFDKISPHFNFQTDYSLINQFYWLEDEWELVNDGYADKEAVFREIVEFVEQVLNFFAVISTVEKIELLSCGIQTLPNNKIIWQEIASNESIITSKWFLFWK